MPNEAGVSNRCSGRGTSGGWQEAPAQAPRRDAAGLIGRDPMGKLYLTKEGRAGFSLAVWLCSGEVSSSAAGGHGAPWFVLARVRR
jgi:hypothetical protein